MLGLANTVSSSSTPESKYSLSFDGAADYVEINDTGFTSLLSTNDDFSISIWFKGGAQTDSTAGNMLLGFFDSGGDNVLRIGVDGRDSKSIFYKAASGNADFGVINLEDDEWHNLIISGVQGTTAFFVDGSALLDGSDSAETSAEDPPWDDVARILIGADLDSTTINDFFEGEIAQISMWSENLDANDIASVYNGGRPINVTYNRGTYDKSANLIGFWQMGNGSFDDKANGAIHDQHNPGFGADVVTDGDFPSLDNWDELNEGGDNQVTLVDGKAKLTYVTGSTTNPLGIRQSGILTIGNTYKITMDVVVTTGNGVKVWTGAGHTENIGTGAHVSYFVASSDNFHIYRQNANTSTTATVDNIVIKQLNGLPGLTSGGPTFSSDTP